MAGQSLSYAQPIDSYPIFIVESPSRRRSPAKQNKKYAIIINRFGVNSMITTNDNECRNFF